MSEQNFLRKVVTVLRRWIWRLLEKLPSIREAGQRETENEKELLWENPFLPYSRRVIEEILRLKQLEYRSFRPILIDTDTPNQHFGEEDDVDQVLSQLEQGLNFLEICTDRPEYFADWKSRMEDEYGLIVRMIPKTEEEPLYGNMILDFERKGPVRTAKIPREMIYLPFQKRRWEVLPAEEVSAEDAKEYSAGEKACETAESKEKPGQDYLDINVPIGYNMLAVRVEKNF